MDYVADNELPPSLGGFGDDPITLDKIHGWHAEACRKSGQSRLDRFDDEGFLHGRQWTPEQERELERQGRTPMVFNHTAKVVQAMVGFRAQNKQEIKYLPRGGSDIQGANTRTELAKYILGANEFDYISQDVALDQYVTGCGWFFVGVQDDDPSRELMMIERVPWQEFRVDPYGRKLDLSDHRYLFREKWIPVVEACFLFPEHADELRGYAGRRVEDYREYEVVRDIVGDDYGDLSARMTGWGDANYLNSDTQHIRLVECWYRMKSRGLWLVYKDGSSKVFKASNEQHQRDLMSKAARLKRGVINSICMVTFVGDVLLEKAESPYSHGYFPYVPMIGWTDQAGMPYGIVRLMKDDQRLINWGFSKLQWIASARFAQTSIGNVDPEEFRRNAALPNGFIEYKKEPIKFESFGENAKLNLDLIQMSLSNVKEIGGAPEEVRGQSSNAISGKAINARQDAALRQQGRFFDNEQRAMNQIGKMISVNMNDFYTEEKIIRITEKNGADYYAAINVDMADQDRVAELQSSNVRLLGSLNGGVADCIVKAVPISDSHRVAQLDELGQLMESLPPEMKVNLLDIYADMTSLPNKEDLIERIKQMQPQNQVQQGSVPDMGQIDPMMQGVPPAA